MIKSPILNPRACKGSVNRDFHLGTANYDLDSVWSPDTGIDQSCVLDLASPKYEPNKTYIFDRSRYGNHGIKSGVTDVRLPSGLMVNGFTGIDVGNDATVRNAGFANNYTIIDIANPANASGNIDSVEIYARTEIGACKVGTFYLVSGTIYKCRASVTIGTVAAGSKQVFSGLTLPIVTGDFIGMYYTSGGVEFNDGQSGDVYYYSGERIDAGDQDTYTLADTYAISLTGYGGDYINCGTGSSLDITTEITIATWIYPTLDVTWKDWIAKWTSLAGAYDKSYALEQSDPWDTISFYLRKADDSDEVSLTAASQLELNKWKHVVATCDNVNQKIYVNSVEVATGAYNFGIHTGASELLIGAQPAVNHYYSGMMRPSPIFNRALSTTEIAGIYQAERHLFS